MEKIKSFIYLDENKMYSISSQLFEGLTEYTLKGNIESTKEEDNQKGNFGSGRVMSQILKSERTESEKKFLHDYAYTLFEKELSERKLLSKLDDTDKDINLQDKQFVKIHGKAIFNDCKAMADTFRDFNEVGEALGYIQLFDINGDEKEASIQQIKDKNERSKAIQGKKRVDSIFKKYLLDEGLNINAKWLGHLLRIYKFGYKDLFTIRIPYVNQNIIFESILNRSFLKEDEFSLITKYSRRTEIAFSIVGLLTQHGGEKVDSPVLDVNSGMKNVNLNIANSISTLGDSFNGRLNNEYIIDPIAIYREI